MFADVQSAINELQHIASQIGMKHKYSLILIGRTWQFFFNLKTEAYVHGNGKFKTAVIDKVPYDMAISYALLCGELKVKPDPVGCKIILRDSTLVFIMIMS